MKNGARPTRTDHRDYDFHKSFGSVVPPSFPDSFNVDAGLWMPDQDVAQAIQGWATIPALPYGCTDYTQADLGNDLNAKLVDNPDVLEAVTHANAQGGADIRTSLSAAQTIGWITGFYNIQPNGIDAFDSIRLAMYSAQPEKRSVSWGTPWYREWEDSAVQGVSIMPMPQTLNPAGLGWHNSKFSGWKTINDVPYLVNKSWQGTTPGDNGWLYFSREVVNAVMTVQGAVAFTGTLLTPTSVQTIDVGLVAWILSFIRNLFNV